MCRIPSLVQNVSNSWLENWVPLSETITSGTPNATPGSHAVDQSRHVLSVTGTVSDVVHDVVHDVYSSSVDFPRVVLSICWLIRLLI